MFVYSMRAGTLRFFGIVAVALVALISLIAFVPQLEPAAAAGAEVSEEAEVTERNFDKIKSNDDRIAFLSQFGWEVEGTPLEETTVTIPREFDKVFADIVKKLSEERTTFVFTENRNKIRLFCEDILYFECQAHYIHIHTKDKVHKICKTMAELYESIDKTMFIQVHKSFVINLNHIREIKETELVLYDADKVIPISRTFKKQVATAFINFKERKYRI